MIRIKFSAPIALVCSIILSSCGSATFDDGTKGRVDENAYHGQKVENLTWFWQCESTPREAPKTSNSSVVIEGGGEHRFKSASFDKTPLIFSGKICPPVTYPRDIIFVIDVSGSMDTNDRRSNNSCGRLKAVEAIINDISSRGGDSRYGIVTFDDAVVAKSSAMFSDRANLFADIAKGNSIVNTICDASGDTSYGPPLSAAESIFQGSRSGAMKEIYFISDGEPHDNAGPSIAQKLHSPGVSISGKSTSVSIATVMLGTADDSVLKNQIASVGSDGQPLHVGDVKASNLAAALSKLAANDILDGKMRYRAIGTDPWKEISLMKDLKDYSFSVPSITIDKSVAPNGLEVSFEYRDQHNNTSSEQGKILWTDTPSPSKLSE
jgi:hypothetical protein